MLARWFNAPLAKKVPELTVYFWIVKVLTTGMGETTSDYFVHTYDPYLVVILAAAALGLVVLIQVAVHRYNAWIYWFAVSMVAVFGTMAAGIVHVYMGVPCQFRRLSMRAARVAIFALWYWSERVVLQNGAGRPIGRLGCC